MDSIYILEKQRLDTIMIPYEMNITKSNIPTKKIRHLQISSQLYQHRSTGT